MTRQISVDLNERNPSLAEASKFFYNRLKKIRQDTPWVRKLEVSEDDRMFDGICLCDLLIDVTTTDRKSSPEQYKQFLLDKLRRLQSLAEKSPRLRGALHGYLPRLKEFAGRDKSLRELYDAYQQAFGGYQK